MGKRGGIKGGNWHVPQPHFQFAVFFGLLLISQ